MRDPRSQSTLFSMTESSVLERSEPPQPAFRATHTTSGHSEETHKLSFAHTEQGTRYPESSTPVVSWPKRARVGVDSTGTPTISATGAGSSPAAAKLSPSCMSHTGSEQLRKDRGAHPTQSMVPSQRPPASTSPYTPASASTAPAPVPTIHASVPTATAPDENTANGEGDADAVAHRSVAAALRTIRAWRGHVPVYATFDVTRRMSKRHLPSACVIVPSQSDAPSRMYPLIMYDNN